MRKVPLGRFAITGRFPSRYSDAPLQYESALEGKFLAILDSDVLLKSIATQQPTVMVDVGGKERKYTPDVLVTWRSDVEWPYGSQTVAFEVKPFAILRDKHYSLAPKSPLRGHAPRSRRSRNPPRSHQLPANGGSHRPLGEQ